MIESSLSQLLTLLYGALAGVVCAVTAWCVKGLREELRLPEAVCKALDLMLWLFAGGVLVWFSLRFGDGRIRIFQVIAAAGGFCVYSLCLGRLTEKGGRLLGRLLRLVMSPAAFMLRGVRLYIEKIYKNTSLAAKKIKGRLHRSTSVGKVRKKFKKNYKKML